MWRLLKFLILGEWNSGCKYKNHEWTNLHDPILLPKYIIVPEGGSGPLYGVYQYCKACGKHRNFEYF